MSNQVKFYGLLILIAVALYGLIALIVPSDLTVTVSSRSTLKGGATLRVDADKTKQTVALPAQLKLRAGRHRLVITPTDKTGEIVEENIRIWPLFSKNITVTLVANTELPGIRGVDNNPYIHFLPHNTASYLLEGDYSADLTVLNQLNLTVLHVKQLGSDPAGYQAERDAALKDAKSYIASVKIPATIPIAVSDEN
jgi:hypothetical protein